MEKKQSNDTLNMIKSDVQNRIFRSMVASRGYFAGWVLKCYLKGKIQSRNQSNSINKVEEYLDFCLRGSKFIIKVLDLIIHSNKQLRKDLANKGKQLFRLSQKGSGRKTRKKKTKNQKGGGFPLWAVAVLGSSAIAWLWGDYDSIRAMEEAVINVQQDIETAMVNVHNEFPVTAIYLQGMGDNPALCRRFNVRELRLEEPLSPQQLVENPEALLRMDVPIGSQMVPARALVQMANQMSLPSEGSQELVAWQRRVQERSMEVIQPSGRRSNRRLTAMEIYRSLRTENGFESTMACHYNNMVAAVSADIYIMAVNLAEKSGIEAPPKGFFENVDMMLRHGVGLFFNPDGHITHQIDRAQNMGNRMRHALRMQQNKYEMMIEEMNLVFNNIHVQIRGVVVRSQTNRKFQAAAEGLIGGTIYIMAPGSRVLSETMRFLGPVGAAAAGRAIGHAVGHSVSDVLWRPSDQRQREGGPEIEIIDEPPYEIKSGGRRRKTKKRNRKKTKKRRGRKTKRKKRRRRKTRR